MRNSKNIGFFLHGEIRFGNVNPEKGPDKRVITEYSGTQILQPHIRTEALQHEQNPEAAITTVPPREPKNVGITPTFAPDKARCFRRKLWNIKTITSVHHPCQDTRLYKDHHRECTSMDYDRFREIGPQF